MNMKKKGKQIERHWKVEGAEISLLHLTALPKKAVNVGTYINT